MPRSTTFEIEARVTFEFTMSFDALDEDQALERMEWYFEKCMRFQYSKVKFPRARKLQEVYVEGQKPTFDVDSCVPEEPF